MKVESSSEVATNYVSETTDKSSVVTFAEIVSVDKKTPLQSISSLTPPTTTSSRMIATPSSSLSTTITATSSFASPSLHAVTYASHGGRDDRFCRAVESSIRNKFELVILGWKKPWRGLSQKLEAAHEYASKLPSRDIIMFTDAFDVLFTGNKATVVENFLSFNTEIVFSAECGCWPHVMENSRDCFDRYPPSPTPYRYLNSGTWIGYANTATEMLAVVMKEAGSNFANANDQKLIADLYMSGRFNIKLDFYNKIFQSMHMTLDPPLPYCNPVSDMTIDASHTWKNTRTHSTPSIIHFNGGGKSHHLQMEGQVWYKLPDHNTLKDKEQLRGSLLIMPGQPNDRLTFDDICPGYVRN